MSTALSKLANLPFFTDLYGAPLDVGEIYIGQPNADPRQNPMTVYWDQAETTPAVQPLSTLGGRVARAGTVAEVFVNPPYSIYVQDKRGQQMLYLANVTDPVAAALGSMAVTPVDTIAALRLLSKATYSRAHVYGYYTPGDLGGGAYWLNTADTTSPDNGGSIIVAADGGRWYLQNTSVMWPEQFGAKGDGTDDTVHLQNLAAALRAQGGGGVIMSRNYTVLTNAATAPGQTVFDLTGTKNPTFLYVGNGAITASYPDTANVGTAWIFGLNGTVGFNTVNAALSAPVTVPTTSGVVHFGVNTSLSAAAPQTKNFIAENVKQSGGLGGLIVYANTTTVMAERASGFKLTGQFSGTFYPANFQGNGDDFEGRIVTRGCGRSYFAYNVSMHEVWVDSDNGTAFDDIDISLYTNPVWRNETSKITVHYKNYGASSLGNGLALNFIQWDAVSRSGNMHDIWIDFDMNVSSYTGAYMACSKYLNAGGPGVPGGPDNNARGYNLYNVRITGACLGTGNTQNLVQFFTQANWTGEIVYNFGFDNFMLSGTNTVSAAIDGRGLSAAGALYFRNTYIGIPTVLTNIPQGVLSYDNALFNGAREDGNLSGTWVLSSLAPGWGEYEYNGSVSVPSGGSGLTLTLPTADKRGANPIVKATPVGTQCAFDVNPISPSSFDIAHNAGAAVLFYVSAKLAI